MRADRLLDDLRGDLRGRALVVVLGCLICQMGLGFGYVFGPLAKEIITELGWTRAEYSFTRLLQLAAMAGASPLVGLWTVRHGARRVLVLATVLLSVLFLLLARMHTLYAYWALMIGIGVALTGLGDVTVGQTVSQWVERRRGLALGLVFVGSNLGGVLLVPAAVALAEATDWRTAMHGLAAVGIGVLLPAALLLVRNRHGPVERVDPAGGSDPRRSGPAGGRADDLGLGEAIRTRSFWILLLSLFSFFFYFLAMLEHLVLYLTDEGMSRPAATAFYTTAVGLGIWSKLGLGLLADRIRARGALTLVYGGITVSSLLLLADPGPAGLWVFVATFGFSYAARDVVHPLIVTWCFGLRNMASIYGTMMLMLVVGGVGPYFAAAVHDATGRYTLAFEVFAILNVVTLGSLLGLRDERRIRADRAAA
jgi:predicted MFS family arabinose efflux permease